MNDNQRYFVEEFAEEYQLGRMSRRDLLRRVLLITGSAPVAAGALLALGCGASSTAPASNGAQTQPSKTSAPPTSAAASPASAGALGAATMPPTSQTDENVVKPDDPAIRTQNVQFPGQAGPLFGYLAQPKGGSAVPGIILVHENRGLVEPNTDIARRYAREGFAVLVVDLVSRAGGTARYSSDPAQIPAILGRTDQTDLLADLQSGLAYLKTVDGVRKDRLGVTGFCFGGNQAPELAIASPEILAAVPFYGRVKLEDLAKSKAAFLWFYGDLDTRVTSQAPDVEGELKRLARPYEIHVEPGAMHAFFNNTGQSYNAAAARDAWPRVLAWFNQYLKA
ncbi:MAG TPA: dienelactone hydrolase family protein [Dehalococcoidia bacterium]|nr:dienelactone hydrolase family protein [Dehalococcoidia bacterium]